MKGLTVLILMMTLCNVCDAQQTKPTTIRFKEFSITFENLAPLNEKELDKTFTSHVAYDADLGVSFEYAIIKVQTSAWEGIEIDQKIETSITIMEEGPHCDLLDWKHHQTAWSRLEEIQKLTFRMLRYNDEEKIKFPDVSLDDLKKVVMKDCGQRWADLVKNVKSVNDYPCGVSVSKLYIRVIGTDKLTRQKVERRITVRIPMGC